MAENAILDLATLGQRYRPALIAYFLRRIHNPAEAEDLAHDVLMRLVEMPAEQVHNPAAYIFRIASNLLMDRHRRLAVRESWQKQAVDLQEAADYLDPLRAAEASEAVGRVANALADLPARSREILLLFRLERMRKRDIADGYGISVSAVDKHLAKATIHLTKRLEDGE